jgi:AcrR family transcriptional regulator
MSAKKTLPRAAPKSYHHGDVRDSALREVKRVLSDLQTRDFALPRIAKTLGISHAALYRHFNGKAGLLAELASEGYRLFGARLSDATLGTSGRQSLRATAVVYCAFARNEPALFRAMFHPLLRDKSQFPELEAEAEKSFRKLGVIVQEVGVSPELPGALVGAIIWSSLHGMAALESDAWLPGRTGLSSSDLEQRAPEALADVLFAGLNS